MKSAPTARVSKVFAVRAKYRTISNGPGHTLYLAQCYVNTVRISSSPTRIMSIYHYQTFLQRLQKIDNIHVGPPIKGVCTLGMEMVSSYAYKSGQGEEL